VSTRDARSHRVITVDASSRAAATPCDDDAEPSFSYYYAVVVLSTQTVDVVIVHTEPRLASTQHRLEEAIHRDAGWTNVQTSPIIGSVVETRDDSTGRH